MLSSLGPVVVCDEKFCKFVIGTIKGGFDKRRANGPMD
jgi:hypothetical protein